MAALARLSWLRDSVPELLLLSALFVMLWSGSSSSFLVCDAATKFSLHGPSQSDAEVRGKVSHTWSAGCKAPTELNSAGFERDKCSTCLDSSRQDFVALQAGLLVSTLCVFLGALVRDVVLWRDTDGGRTPGTTSCMRFFTNPLTVVGFVATLATGVVVVWYGVHGYTCKSNDGSGWVHVVASGHMSIERLLVAVLIIFLRVGAIALDTVSSMVAGDVSLILYHARGLSKDEFLGAYDGEIHSLLSTAAEPDLAGMNQRLKHALRPWVAEFYATHNPQKTGDVERILQNYVDATPGDERALFDDLHQKYPVKPPGPPPPVPRGQPGRPVVVGGGFGSQNQM